jgi:hypothetical protein
MINLFICNEINMDSLQPALQFYLTLYLWFQGLGIRPGVIDGAISISAVQV